eukprot:2238065-Rhodomonas_salina.1
MSLSIHAPGHTALLRILVQHHRCVVCFACGSADVTIIIACKPPALQASPANITAGSALQSSSSHLPTSPSRAPMLSPMHFYSSSSAITADHHRASRALRGEQESTHSFKNTPA